MTELTSQPPAAGSARVEISGVSKSYGGHRALAGIDLDIAPGEFLALLGPSGCGKTTLLRCIAGLVSPDSGDIRVNGQSLVALPAHKRNLGMVFQSYALFPHMTVRRNVAFGLRVRGQGEPEAPVRAALDLVRMGDFGDRYPRQLSGGQQQRVALARALVTQPRILLLDEPLAALDAKLRESMQIELKQLQRRLGITAIFVTHDQREALTMSDRVAVMSEGCIEQVGSPEVIYRRPATAFVADFIGQTSKMSGRVRAVADGRAAIVLDGADMAIEAAAPPVALRPGDAAVVMVRPESVTFTAGTAPPATAAHHCRGRIAEDLFVGERRLVVVDTPHGAIVAGNRGDAGAARLPPGTEGWASWQPADMLVFPAQASERTIR